ncbi:hypothetical protein PAMC26510_03350 [Caballeronia sordidicola]|uniref:Uncharacterized protein n=1 Tax=Caballeronia sordidicola TaxID=196367 RepID=A0A242N963_CABSO|nr:hypothetical protein PAMC26510_03350 [Caballeronia sordidicola]
MKRGDPNEKLKHTLLDLHNERTFRQIVMQFCNFSRHCGNLDGRVIANFSLLKDSIFC